MDPLTQEDYRSCYRSPEQTKTELEALEVQLAIRHNLTGNAKSIREQLIQLDQDNNLPEDEVVADWHQTLSAYLCDLKHGR